MAWMRGLLIGVLAGVLALAAPAHAQPTDDPLAPQQHHLERVGAYQAWEQRRGAGVVVAVLDTGVDLEHPDLEGRIAEGVDLVERDTPPDDPLGHGTLVAGIIAATTANARGVAGVARDAQVMPVRVLDAEGRGRSDIVAEGIYWAVEHGARVINLSLAEVDEQNGLSLTLLADFRVEQAIRDADAAGAVVVAAAGNDGQDQLPYESDAPLLVVGATNREDQRWPQSNADERTLFAPGTEILSTWHESRYAKADGTSFSTPIVAAGAALLAEAGVSAPEVRRLLTETAVDIGVGVGRIDLPAAIAAIPPSPSPSGSGVPEGPIVTPPPPPPPLPPPAPSTPPPPFTPDPDGPEPVTEVTEIVVAPPPATPAPPPPVATTAPSLPASEAAQVAIEPFSPIPVTAPPSIPVATGGPARAPLLLVASALLAADLIGVAALRRPPR